VSLLNGLQNDLHVLYVECDVKLYSLSQCYFGSADSLVILWRRFRNWCPV